MINVTGLTKHYGQRRAVDDLSFELAAGRVTGFVGPNGAGKSTTMRMMVDLSRPDRGEVRYDGVPYVDLAHPARTVGSVLDARCLHPGRTARNHLRPPPPSATSRPSGPTTCWPTLGSSARPTSGRAGSRSACASGCAATALLGDPVLLLDEPSNGLDPDGIRWLRNRLRSFADAGGTVFVSSHLITELAKFADDLVVVGAGRLIAAETVDSVTSRTGMSLEESLLEMTTASAEFASA